MFDDHQGNNAFFMPLLMVVGFMGHSLLVACTFLLDIQYMVVISILCVSLTYCYMF